MFLSFGAIVTICRDKHIWVFLFDLSPHQAISHPHLVWPPGSPQVGEVMDWKASEAPSTCSEGPVGTAVTGWRDMGGTLTWVTVSGLQLPHL